MRDWNEFHDHLPETTLQEQGARCMDCGVPFCHTGRCSAAWRSGCPINNLIPEWNDLVYRGQWREALARLHKTNNFPEFTGRVCPAPCEGSCVLGINEPAVTIKSIECAIIDKGFEEGWVVPEPPADAHRQEGRRRRLRPGGPGRAPLSSTAPATRSPSSSAPTASAACSMYGIPNMKLDKNVVERRVKLMAQEGVIFVTSAEVGKTYPTAKLLADFDAIVLCGGATEARDLPGRGAQAQGHPLRDGVPAQEQQEPARQQLRRRQFISAKGKNVIVIGGGDTGTDCVGTALRHGCKSLVQFEILPRPPDERAADNPWPQWPQVYKLDYGQEEAAALYGADPRRYVTVTKRFVGDAGGNLQGAAHDRGRVGEERRRPLRHEGEAGHREGLAGRAGAAGDGLPRPREGRACSPIWAWRSTGAATSPPTHDKATSVKGVFAAGDMARGQSLIVWAIEEGRAAARGVDRFLMGETLLP